MTTPRRRADAALALRLAGASHADIAHTLGYRGPVQAQTAVEKALAGTLSETARDQQRELAGMRIERLLRSIWPKALDDQNPDHIAAVRTARELIDRYAKLYGLDAPEQVIVHTPTTDAIDAWVTSVLAQGVPDVEVADVIDVEPLDELDGEAG